MNSRIFGLCGALAALALVVACKKDPTSPGVGEPNSLTFELDARTLAVADSFHSFAILSMSFVLRSTASADAAPRETASNENTPLPANRSRKRAPRMRSPAMLKYACRARSEVGRTSRGGTAMRRPRSVPAVIRTLVIVPRS